MDFDYMNRPYQLLELQCTGDMVQAYGLPRNGCDGDSSNTQTRYGNYRAVSNEHSVLHDEAKKGSDWQA